MKYIHLLIIAYLSIVHSHQEEEEEYEYIAAIDPVRRALSLAANNRTEARRLGGVYGLCDMDVTIPEFGALVCDPPNSLPQICTLACKQGYYSSGIHRDIVCADAMCEGQCASQKYECKGTQLKFATRDCDVTRYVPCDETEFCIETVTESCSYSFYEEVSRPCCNLTTILAPDNCWNSGCTGSCDNPGVYHYYSNTCADVCPPWRDPEVPQFSCSPCQVPTIFNPHVRILSTDTNDENEIPSQITVGCEKGYWGNIVTSYCTSADGSFYPPVSNINCNPCSEPPNMEGDMFERVDLEPGSVEFRCLSGFVGESTFSSCDNNGIWSSVTPPYCDLAPTVSVSPSASVSVFILLDSEEPSPSNEPTTTQSTSPSFSATMTPSASKSPRPPKVKGSRAPTQPPKLRIK